MATREEILRLIRFHSAQLDRAVSQDKFEELTGIKRHEWSGRIWARWNDALAEAGLAPNRFGQDSYDNSLLIHLLGDMVLEMGRVPSHADLALKRTQDPNFPAASTFQTRLGGAAARVELLAQLALEEERYRPVYDVVAPSLKKAGTPVQPAQEVPQSYPGRVYLIRSGDLYKIGKTDNPTRRYNEVQLVVPGKIEEIHVLETDDPTGIETYWHRRFASKRRAGEWFELNDADVAAFRRRGGFM